MMQVDFVNWITSNFHVTSIRGSEYNIRCKLHEDKVASASINVDKKVFNCAVCGGMSVWTLSKRLGIAPPETKIENACYNYYDQDGKLLYQIKRYTNKKDGTKSFKAYDPAKQEYGIANIERVPYNLPGILKAVNENKPIFIAEGEKDCDALISRELQATTNNGGCGNTKLWESFTKYFPEGHVVYIFKDHDEPGEKHARRVAKILTEAKCDVRIVDLGYPIQEKHGRDISDWIQEKHSPKEFETLLANAKSFGKLEVKEITEKLVGDYGHATVLAKYFTSLYRWANHKECWMFYNGKYWKETRDELVTLEAAEYLKKEYKRRMDEKIDYANYDFYSKGFYDSNLVRRLSGTFIFLKGWPSVCVDGELWDKNQWLLNVNNGTIDLQSFILRNHDPNDLITKFAPVDYDSGAYDCAWKAHLEYFIPNVNIRREVQRNLGIGLSGAVMDEILPIWWGTGGNGKTTTAQVLTKVLGSYVRNSRATLLTNSDEHPEAIADLAGSRFVFCSELTRGTKLAEGFVKSLTGGETKRARFLYGSRFDFEQTFSVFLFVNDKPKITGTDEGIWRRIRLIPWEIRVEAGKKLSQAVIQKQLLENNSAILNWLLDGLKDFINEPHWIAQEVQSATDCYRAQENIFSGFILETMENEKGRKVLASEIYDRFKKYCEEKNEDVKSNLQLYKFLSESGYRKDRGHANQIYFVGLKFKEEISGGLFSENTGKEKEICPLIEDNLNSIQKYTENTLNLVTLVTETIPTSRVPTKSMYRNNLDTFPETSFPVTKVTNVEESIQKDTDKKDKIIYDIF